LIGIGGIGMSAIAQVLHEQGAAVKGSNNTENEVVRRLRAEGIEVTVGHDAANVDGADIVVYSAAIPDDNPEIVEARRRGLPLLERPVMLGRVMDPYRRRVAVSGTHGKTTTTSMIDAILVRAGLDATTLIGGDVSALGRNARLGSGSIVVAEACEAFGSFLHLRPSIAVITNIDADHLDYYGTIERIEDGFRQFVKNTDPDGCVIACWDDTRVRKVLDGCGRRVVWFGLSGSPNIGAVEVDVSRPRPVYTLVRDGEALGTMELGVPGEQNVVDSLAAAAVAFELGATFEDVRAGLAGFRGAVRRFDILFDDRGIMVVDDYAHHPAEIAATLRAARSGYGKRIIAVFQPHLYSRTQAFTKEFAEFLSLADEVIVTAIYAARDLPIEGVSGEDIVRELRSRGFANARYVSDKETLPRELANTVRDGDMVLVLGAGDIRQVAERLASELVTRQ
jgi:UDP-N-acetylmuramate--alanine ligase